MKNMVIKFGVKEHMKMADTYQWAEQELERQRSRQLEILEDSRRYWKGEAADTLRREQEGMLQEGEYADYLKHVRGMKEIMEESIPQFRRLQQMVAELPTAYGLPCDDMVPETLYLDEEALRRFHELTDEILKKNRYACEELSSIMDGCEGLVDFGAQRRELEELREEMRRMEEFKRKMDEYADGMRRMDRWMEERLSEYVRIGDGERKPRKEIRSEKLPVTSSDDTGNETNIYFLNDYFDSGEEFSKEEIYRILEGALLSADITQGEYENLKELFTEMFNSTDEIERQSLYERIEAEYNRIIERKQNEKIEWAVGQLKDNNYDDEFIGYMVRYQRNMLCSLYGKSGDADSDVMEQIEQQYAAGYKVDLCKPLVAYRGNPQVETFDHTIQLGSYNPYYHNDIDNPQENRPVNCYSPAMEAREQISPRSWYAYLNNNSDKMENYYINVGLAYERSGDSFTVQSGDQKFFFHLEKDTWWVDEDGRYLITVGPKVLNIAYGKDDEDGEEGMSLDFKDFAEYFGCRIDVILVNDDDPSDILTIECVYGGDIKEHTYSNGVYMTGISFLDKDGPAEEADGSIVEFMGSPPPADENNPGSNKYDNGSMSDYHIELMIVYDNAAEEN